MKRRAVWLLVGCFFAASLQIGCGGSASTEAVVMEEAAAEAPMEEIFFESNSMAAGTGSADMKDMEFMDEATASTEEGTGNDAFKQSEEAETIKRKLIRTVNLNLETENYDSLIAGLEQQIEILGGYIEYKDAYHGNYNSKMNGYGNRHANITARIPAAKLDEFTKNVGKISNITYESESVEDVTLKYVDLSSHKKMLLAQQERLMELLENAATMEDIITIESRLSEVRYQIESMESQLRTFDNQVDYSTVHINVEEVERYTPQPEKGVWERIRVGFSDNVYRVTNGIKNFGIEFVIAIPILVTWAVVITLGVVVIRLVMKKVSGDKHQKSSKMPGIFHKKNTENKKSEES